MTPRFEAVFKSADGTLLTVPFNAVDWSVAMAAAQNQATHTSVGSLQAVSDVGVKVPEHEGKRRSTQPGHTVDIRQDQDAT